MRTFVPLLPINKREEVAINDTLEHIQNQNPHVLWPEIEGNPINEFQSSGIYHACIPDTLSDR